MVLTLIPPASRNRAYRPHRSLLKYDAETATEARELIRNSVAFYASTPDYRRVLDQHGLADLQPKLRQMTREGAWAEMASEISDEVLDLFCVAGPPGLLCEGLAQRWGGLVDQISLPVHYWLRHADSREWQDASAALAAQ